MTCVIIIFLFMTMSNMCCYDGIFYRLHNVYKLWKNLMMMMIVLLCPYITIVDHSYYNFFVVYYDLLYIVTPVYSIKIYFVLWLSYMPFNYVTMTIETCILTMLMWQIVSFYIVMIMMLMMMMMIYWC